MKNTTKLDLPVVILAIIVFTFCVVVFQAMQTNARASAKSGQKTEGYELTPGAYVELSAQLRWANAEISKLKARLHATESREKVLQSHYGDLNRQMSLLRGQIQSSGASTADDPKGYLKIEKVTRVAGGKPEPLDMVVSINKFSITWKHIDAILDKLDEIAQRLSQP